MPDDSSEQQSSQTPMVARQESFEDAKEPKVNVVDPLGPEARKRGLKFWMCIVAIMLASFLMALDLVGIATALPVIVGDLHGTQFEWVGSAYALSATAFLPLSGGLAQVFGRRPIMLLQIFIFAVGSALCGAATSVNFLIAGRTIQGIGAGGIASLSQIVISDLVPLHERGSFNALLALAYSMSSGVAPLIGGSLAESGQWRWFFYMNIPICGLAALTTAVFMDLQVPRGSFKEKLLKLDWIGNAIVVSSTTAVVIALTWGGIEFPWNSARVLTPLIIGVVGLIAFLVYDAKVPKLPLVPFSVMSTRTALSGYLQGFFTNFYMLGIFYYLPVYYQGSKDATPIGSGVDCLGLAFATMPFGIAAGISVAKSGRYRPQLWIAWACLMVAAGLFSTLHAESSRAASIGYQIVLALGLGILLTCTFFPVLAPIPVSLNAPALAFFMFVRYFSQAWGVAVGGTVLQNELKKRLPAEFLAQFPQGTSVAYSIIPSVRGLENPLKHDVQVAFAESVRVFWQVLIGVAGAGLLASLLMEGIPLHKQVDEDWGLKEGEEEAVQAEIAVELGEARPSPQE